MYYIPIIGWCEGFNDSYANIFCSSSPTLLFWHKTKIVSAKCLGAISKSFCYNIKIILWTLKNICIN